MRGTLGTPDSTARFGQMFSNSRPVNILAAARVLLFASRDVWFVVGLPVYLESEQGWSFWQAGAFLAVWVIGYGAVQAVAPRCFVVEQAEAQTRAERANRHLARVRARAFPRGDRDRARCEHRPDDRSSSSA